MQSSARVPSRRHGGGPHCKIASNPYVPLSAVCSSSSIGGDGRRGSTRGLFTRRFRRQPTRSPTGPARGVRRTTRGTKSSGMSTPRTTRCARSVLPRANWQLSSVPPYDSLRFMKQSDTPSINQRPLGKPPIACLPETLPTWRRSSRGEIPASTTVERISRRFRWRTA